MRILKLQFAVTILLCLQASVKAQDTTKVSKDTSSLMNQLETESTANKTNHPISTFGYTRVIDGHSVDNLPAHVLDVRISHRFGPINKGLYNFFGLDYSPFNVRVGFDYGITNNFMIGGGHSAWQKTYDAFFKLKILRQSSGDVNMPVSVSFVPTVAICTLKAKDVDPLNKPDPSAKEDPISYVFQVLIARKFSEGLSLQIMPTFVHSDNISFNHLSGSTYRRDILAVGIAGNQKISKKMSISGEYYYQLDDTKASKARNALSFSLNIGTGGHVFQLMFTNAIGLTEKSFITESAGRWEDGDVMFGFNISRVFQLGKKHKGESADWKKK